MIDSKVSVPRIVPCYVPDKSKSSPCFTRSGFFPYVLTNNFNMSKLQLTIFSRKSIAFGLDNISPLMLKHLLKNVLESFL